MKGTPRHEGEVRMAVTTRGVDRKRHSVEPARAIHRVLLVDTLSGTNDYGVALASSLSQRVSLTVITVANTLLTTAPTMRVLPVVLRYGDTRGRLRKVPDVLKYVWVLARELWRHRNDCVHVQFFRLPAVEVPLYVFARPWLRCLVHTAHNALPHERRWWHGLLYRVWYRLVDRIHVLGQHTATELVRMGIHGERITVIPHGNYDDFARRHPPARRDVTRARLGIPQDAVLFLQYGNLREYKGAPRLIDAFCSPDLSARSYLVVAGWGEEGRYAELSNRLCRSGRSSRGLFLKGFLSDQQLSDLIEASDVLVFPYVAISQSGALLLGMSYGKAIIASDLPGFRDYAQHQVDALLVDTADLAEMTRAMSTLCEDEALRERLGRNARGRAATEYSWPRITSDLVRLYRPRGEG
jgi:glycosyltransferase involved in cell wall biosynthesis